MSRWLDEIDETGGSVSTVLNYVPDKYIKSIGVTNRILTYINQDDDVKSVDLDNNLNGDILTANDGDTSGGITAAGVLDVYIESVSFTNGIATALTKTKDEDDIYTDSRVVPEVNIKSASVLDCILTVVDQDDTSTPTRVVPADRTLQAVVDKNGNILKESDGLTCRYITAGKFQLNFLNRTDALYEVSAATQIWCTIIVREITTGSCQVRMLNAAKAAHNMEFRVTFTEIA